MMKIALASDHGGFELKESVKNWLSEQGYEVADLGTDDESSVDYPPYGVKCAEYVVAGKADKGIVFCGTGIGISIAANKVKGARCALCTSETLAELAASHNQANLIALGGRTTTATEARAYIQRWLATPPDLGPRHVHRVALINALIKE
jgi:ribose 5-phosphate isomerase B